MNPFEKILERLEKYEYNDLIEHNSEQCEHCKSIDCGIGMDCTICVMDKAKEIVQEVEEEYNNGWIPCSERLPEECIEVLVSVQEIDGSTYTITSWIQDAIWVIKKTPLHPTVIAWQPLPEPYQQNGE